MTLKQLKDLLKLNAKLLKYNQGDTKRLFELLVHRSLVKDMIIEIYEKN